MNKVLMECSHTHHLHIGYSCFLAETAELCHWDRVWPAKPEIFTLALDGENLPILILEYTSVSHSVPL